MHRPFPLSEGEMTVFSSIIEALVRPMIQTRCDLTLGGTTRAQFVREEPLRNKTKTFYQAAQQPFCRPFVPFRLEDFVQHEAMLIDRTPEPKLATSDFDSNFIEVPYITWAFLALSQVSSDKRAKLGDPTSDSFVRRVDPALKKHLFNSTQAQIEANVKPNRIGDDLRRKPMTLVADR